MLPLGLHSISKSIINTGFVRAIHWSSTFDTKKLEEKIANDSEFVHRPGRGGNTILHRVAKVEPKNPGEAKKLQESVLFLLRNGADPEKQNKQGKTPSDLAEGQLPVQQLLLRPLLHFK